jgi:glucose-6-phosphate isomerase
MTNPNNTLSSYAAFDELNTQAATLRNQSVSQMLEEDNSRVQDFSLSAVGLHIDYSKQLLDRDSLAALLELSNQANISQRISALFNGEHINNTEDRPALHTLLRSENAGGLAELHQEVTAVNARMKALADAANNGELRGYSGEAFTDVVNIGIGGSDLGPRLVTEALAPYGQGLRGHYVANVDPADIHSTVANLNPATTLFIICSKSFRTEETLANGIAARDWMLAAGADTDDLNRHFLAVTTNIPAATEFGISEENCLPMWDWVGGRYSVWSAVGLSCAMVIGWENFSGFLSGGSAMDEHFKTNTAAGNMPLLLSLLEIWNCNFLGAGNHVVLPYDHSLRHLPDYLQQLTMESNGKSVSAGGEDLTQPTAPVLWGSAGTIGQHSYHQLLHQGTRLCPVDFVAPLNTHTELKEQHRKLVANCFAQSRTLMVGRSLEEAQADLLSRGLSEAEATAKAPHLTMAGNRPNSVISMDVLSPKNLGALLALYEHRTFCSSQIWGINPFDQWGVEVGKVISSNILEGLSGEGSEKMDASTEELMQRWRQAQR